MIEFELKMNYSYAVPKEKHERLSECALMKEVAVDRSEVLFFLV
jgi:hypothetical protein